MSSHSHEHIQHAGSNIKVAFFLNLGFTLLEIVGGIWTNSLAIVSDALHDLGDSFSLGLAWYLDNYSQRTSDRRYSYGYRRFSMLGALLNTVILIGGSLFILSEAVPRLFNPEPSNAPGMILFAIGGIAVNGLAMLRMRSGKSLNERVVTWHLLEDVLGWVAVLVVGVTLLFFEIYILDPLLSILITLYVLYNVARNLRRTLALFLQAVPEEVNIEDIEAYILGLERVDSVHHTHVWSLDGEHHVMTTHVVMKDSPTREEICHVKDQVKGLRESMDFDHITVEIEYPDEICGMD